MIKQCRSAAKILIAFLAVGLVFVAMLAPSAFATNGHQDHQGACARSTESISKGVGDLRYNGVLQDFANSLGIHGFNGSLTKQMEEKLVVGVAVRATAMSNHGCTGTGGVFGAGTRVIEKGEHVVVRIPPIYGKEACKHPNHKCKKVRIVVHTAFPVSCWNKNGGRLEVYIFVRVRKPHKHPPKKHKPPKKHRKSCAAQGKINVNGNCVRQENHANVQQECEAKENYQWTGSQCVVTIIQINANCSNVTVGNEGNVNQGGNCNNGGTETCVGNNNCNVEEEHPCGCEPKEPEPKIMITAKTELNMIPAGKTSGEFYISTYASKSSGTLTVDPGIGGVSSCNSTTPKGSLTTNVPSGASEACVILYAPEDKDKPSSMTVTMTACLGAVCDTETETVPITYPTRPS